MAEYEDREHYIPLRKSDLVALLLSDKKLPYEQREDFKQFCKLISAVFHFEYLERLERLKDDFAPFDPDSQTRPLKPLNLDQREKKLEELFAEFRSLMERANFEKKVDSYGRLVLMMKLRPHKRLGDNIDTKAVFLKLFKDIPKLDLEMVLPGTRMQMPKAQKGKLGASLLGTIGYGIYKVWFDIITAAKMAVGGALTFAGQAALGPLVLLGGYGYKQYAGYQITKQTYSKMLTESLYYQNLDNNAGVLTQLLDEAEEQECREAILAYFCLLEHAPPQGWTAPMLDDYVEMYLEGNANLKVDFEIGDALDKVERLGVVEKHGEFYKAVPLATALERLDYRWDNYFQYNKA